MRLTPPYCHFDRREKSVHRDAEMSPSQLEITAGSTVTWTNAGAVVHTVAGEGLALADSGTLHPGDSFSQPFDEPGVYSYRCGPHAFMSATIVVT